jgi:nucleoside-diphosphate-sugar epimerase
LVLVTGAGGQVGREVCRVLRTARIEFLPVDVDTRAAGDLVACDLRRTEDVARLFASRAVRTVIHLAAILPSAFRADPLAGVDLNLNGCFELMRQAVGAGVKRFVFASSMSVYGSAFAGRTMTEDHPAAPDDPYGTSKRVVETVGEILGCSGVMEFVSLRIARVVGPGIKKSSSPWRSEIFERSAGREAIQIPFAREAELSLVHAHDVGRMLVTLAEAPRLGRSIYNTPAEIWKVGRLKEVVEETTGVRVELGEDGTHGGPVCDGGRFTREFGFQLRGLRERLLDAGDRN